MFGSLLTIVYVMMMLNMHCSFWNTAQHVFLNAFQIAQNRLYGPLDTLDDKTSPFGSEWLIERFMQFWTGCSILQHFFVYNFI